MDPFRTDVIPTGRERTPNNGFLGSSTAIQVRPLIGTRTSYWDIWCSSRFVIAAALALLIYEFFITFDDEVNLIWMCVLVFSPSLIILFYSVH